MAALRGKPFQVAELLHRSGADVDVRDRFEDTPLREACRSETLYIVRWLLNIQSRGGCECPGLRGLGSTSQCGILWTLLSASDAN